MDNKNEATNKPCPHEDNIEYRDLLQLDGEALYIVHCLTCGSDRVIPLVEDGDHENWGLSEKDIEDIIKYGV